MIGTKTMTAAVVLSMIKPLIVAGLIVLVGYIAIRLICKMLMRALEKTKLDPILFTFAANCTKVVLWILVALTAMNALGIPPTSILTALGACGVAIALALQSSLGNFAGGVLIIVTKPFAKGDYINNLSVEGTVQQIDLLCTTIHTVDNKVITVPNGTLANNTIIKCSIILITSTTTTRGTFLSTYIITLFYQSTAIILTTCLMKNYSSDYIRINT